MSNLWKALLDLTDFFNAPEHTHTHEISAPPTPPPSTPTSSYPFLYIKWTIPYPRSLHTNIINHYQWEINNRKTILERKPNNVWNVQVCFRLLIFFKTTTSFQQTATTLSLHNQISTSTTTFQKNLFCYFILNSTRNQFHWLTNYSHYLTNPRPI